MSFNSTEWAWSDISLHLNGERIGKVTKITSKTSRETEALYGEGDEPFDINGGNKAYSGEIETFGTVIAKMNRAAVALGFNDLTDLPWQVDIVFKPTLSEPKQIISIPNVRFSEFEEGGSQNEKSLKKLLPYTSLAPQRK